MLLPLSTVAIFDSRSWPDFQGYESAYSIAWPSLPGRFSTDLCLVVLCLFSPSRVPFLDERFIIPAVPFPPDASCTHTEGT